jgi:hypothetical protein
MTRLEAVQYSHRLLAGGQFTETPRHLYSFFYLGPNRRNQSCPLQTAKSLDTTRRHMDGRLFV